MNIEFLHRGIRFTVGPDHAGERMWTIHPEAGVMVTGAVERTGLEDTLRQAIVEAQLAIDEWLETLPG